MWLNLIYAYYLQVFALASYTERSFGYRSKEVGPRAELKPPPMYRFSADVPTSMTNDVIHFL